MRRIILFLLAGLLLIPIAGWVLISAPFLGDLRASLVQNWIERAGGGLVISGPVSIGLGKVVHVAAEGIELDSPGGTVSLAKAEADLSLSDLLHGKFQPTAIGITGASVVLVRDAQGKIAGRAADRIAASTGTTAQGTATRPDPESIRRALAGKTVRLVDTRISFQDQISNFAFDAQLATLALQGDARTGGVSLQGTGTLNGQPLDLSLSIPKDAPLSAMVTSGATSLSFTGAEGSKGLSGALPGQILAQSTDLSQTLNILLLEPVLQGTAKAGATLGQTEDGDLALTGIDASVVLHSGPSARISGALGNLRKLDDADIAIDISFYAAGQEPPPALRVQDLRLTAFRQTLAGPLKGDTRRSMTITTNGFRIETSGVGPAPVKFSGIARGPAGELVIGNLLIQIGPVAAPWVSMTGRVGDLLKLSGVSVNGQVAFPMSTIVVAGNQRLPAELGSVTGRFKVSGPVAGFSLTDIFLATQDTDLWSLGISGSVASVVPMDGVDLTLDAGVKTAAILKALGKEPVDLEPLDIHVMAASTDNSGTVAAKLLVRMAETSVVANLLANNRGPGPVVQGTVTSDLIRLEDLRDGLLAATEITAGTDDKAPPVSGRKRPMPRPQPEKTNNVVQDITLVFFDKDRLLRYGDVNVAITAGKIAGETTVTGIKADLVLAKGKTRFGPLKFPYGGGQFDLLATMDTIAAPDTLRLQGSGDGWDFGKVMKLMKVKTPASGTIDAVFDIAGSHTSLASFINTMDGSATVRMKNGAIATSLLDLAGLGVIPWLFSKDRRDKYASITCLRAPLAFRDGVLTTDETVVETRDVQLVAYGTINIPGGTLNVAGQPRRIGKPLTRSPWPFTLSGALTKPKVKVKDGPSKLRRVDGANTMPASRVPCVPDILQLRQPPKKEPAASAKRNRKSPAAKTSRAQ